MIVFDNGRLGLVRQQQELFYGGRYSASRFESRIDFAAIARGFGIESERVAEGRDVEGPLARAINVGPRFLSIELRPEENVLPMVPPGGANIDAIAEEA